MTTVTIHHCENIGQTCRIRATINGAGDMCQRLDFSDMLVQAKQSVSKWNLDRADVRREVPADGTPRHYVLAVFQLNNPEDALKAGGK